MDYSYYYAPPPPIIREAYFYRYKVYIKSVGRDGGANTLSENHITLLLMTSSNQNGYCIIKIAQMKMIRFDLMNASDAWVSEWVDKYLRYPRDPLRSLDE